MNHGYISRRSTHKLLHFGWWIFGHFITTTSKKLQKKSPQWILKCVWCLSINKIQCIRNVSRWQKKMSSHEMSIQINQKFYNIYPPFKHSFISITLTILQVELTKNFISSRVGEVGRELFCWNPVDQFNMMQYSFVCSTSVFTFQYPINSLVSLQIEHVCFSVFTRSNLSDEKVSNWPI